MYMEPYKGTYTNPAEDELVTICKYKTTENSTIAEDIRGGGSASIANALKWGNSRSSIANLNFVSLFNIVLFFQQLFSIFLLFVELFVFISLPQIKRTFAILVTSKHKSICSFNVSVHENCT